MQTTNHMKLLKAMLCSCPDIVQKVRQLNPISLTWPEQGLELVLYLAKL
jgi:hypothetical protein